MEKITSFLQSIDVDCNWKTILVGYSLGIISTKEVQDFAVDFLQFENTPDEVNELAWGVEELELKSTLERVVQKTDDEVDEVLERRKLRLALLLQANGQYQGNLLLRKIEEVYSTFNYPKEMESLIYYMPYEKSSNDENLSGEERIIRDFEKFLESEKKDLQTGFKRNE